MTYYLILLFDCFCSLPRFLCMISVRFQRILLGSTQPWTFYQKKYNWSSLQNYAHPKHYLLASYSLVYLYVTLHFLRPQVFWWHRVHDWQPTKSLLENLLDVHYTSCDVGNPDRQYHPHVTGESFLLCLERGQGMKTKAVSLIDYFEDIKALLSSGWDRYWFRRFPYLEWIFMTIWKGRSLTFHLSLLCPFMISQ